MPKYGKKALSDFRKEIGSRTPEGTADFSNPEHLQILAELLNEKEQEFAREGSQFAKSTVYEHLLKDEIEALNNAPVEADTRIIKSKITLLSALPCRYEYWAWDGVYAETIVFLQQHVQDMKDEEIVNLCEPLLEESANITIKKRDGYVFFNFNFHIN
jgi:hypothetical protein